MNRLITALLLIVILLANYACKKEIDDQKPVISTNFAEAFPVNCDTLYFGDTNTIQLLFSDNKALGSYGINIHNNFNHHTHSTEVIECNMEEDKEPLNPYMLVSDYTLSEELNAYQTHLAIYLPRRDGKGDFDEGDYHFFITLVDAEGWSSQMGLSVKIVQK